MNSIRAIQALNKRELENVVAPSASWHTDYRDTAYIHIGGLPFDLTEGDIVTIFSQFGEPVWLKLARDKETGKSRGFAWLKYEDQRSTDLAVDNLGGTTIDGRMLKVDHTRYTKKDEDEDESQFDVPFDNLDPPQEKHGHRHRKRRHRDGNKERSRRSPKLLEDELERSDEDPMREYLAQENHERRRSKERKRSRDKDRDRHRRSHRDHDDEKHSRHRSSRD